MRLSMNEPGNEADVAKSLTRNAHVIAFVAALLLVATIGMVTWFQFSSARRAQAWVDHSNQVVRSVNNLGTVLRDAETGQRGFLLTGSDRYLAPYSKARDQIILLQSDLARLTADNPEQQQSLRNLAPITQKKMDELAQTIQLYRNNGTDAALTVVRTNDGQDWMEQIRAVLAEMVNQEDHLLAFRQQNAHAAEAATRVLAFGIGALALILLAVAVRMLGRVRVQLAQAEAHQRQTAEQMRAAFDSVSQGIAAFSADEHLLRLNDGFTALLDLPRAMVRPGTSYDAIAEQAAADAKEPFLETAEQIRHGPGGRSVYEPVVYERTRATDGRSLEMRRTATRDGGFVLTVTDVTERVRAEATARDTQRLQAMGQLTGGIAHDFNNLLTVVLGNLEIVSAKLETAHPLRPRVERAIWGAQRGASLTQQLLAFARKQPLVPMPIDLSGMLPDMTNLLRRTLGEHIDVRVVDAAGLWPAMTDPAQLESALLNLALNARDAMLGGGRLTIEVANKVLDTAYARQHTEVTPGDYIMLAVSDTGTGMTPEIQARVFEPFFTTKEPGKGTGLGLPMVFGFMKQSGGHIKIYSEPGEGTTIRMYLPRAIGVAAAVAPRAAMPVELPRGSGTVLVVEDEPAVREVAVGILRDLGYRVLETGDGPDAMRVFGENDAKIDLLLCDVVLPGGMKGNEVSRRLTEIRPALRTLFMSGYTENAIVHHGRLDDGVQLLGKPFSRETLARKVADVLEIPSVAVRLNAPGNVVDLNIRDRTA